MYSKCIHAFICGVNGGNGELDHFSNKPLNIQIMVSKLIPHALSKKKKLIPHAYRGVYGMHKICNWHML
jgi:hypothetical protein